MNIYEITREAQEIESILEENGGELTAELEERMKLNADALNDKGEGYVKWLKNTVAEYEACKAEKQKLDARMKSLNSLAERIKGNLMTAMIAADRPKCVFGAFKASVVNTTRVEVVEEAVDALPEEYKRVKHVVEPNKTALAAAMKSGETFDGCELVTTQTLRVS